MPSQSRRPSGGARTGARRGKRARVTMCDVARAAGVSQSLVSLVLAGNTSVRVAQATRQRILRVAGELGYRPNMLAQALKRRRNFAIGVIVPDLRNSFFADIVSGAERVATEQGYAVLLCDALGSPAERHLEALRSRQVDGVIIDALGAATLADGSLDDFSVVLVDEPSDRIAGVASDAEGAGRLAAEHLLGLGHRSIAYIGPASDVWAFRMRERGFFKALRKAGVAVPPDLLRRAAPTVDGGRTAMRALLALEDRPGALFCANDLVAIGALKECAAHGVRVPAELSIVGCDDIETARLVTPELTTVAIPARELGARAARQLLGLLDGAPARVAGRPLAVRLMVRGTTARSPGHA